MSKRETRMWHFVIKRFDDFQHSRRIARNFTKELLKECADKNYSAICYTGVSECDSDLGEVKVGFRGRKEYVPTSIYPFAKKYKEFIEEDIINEPHLHILLFANPGETLKEFTRDYFKDRGYDFWKVENFNNDVYSMLRYIMKQSKKSIRGYANIDGLPQAALDEFARYAEIIGRSMNENRPIFRGLPMSEAYHRADACVLKKTHRNELFTEICLTPQKQIEYGYVKQTTTSVESAQDDELFTNIDSSNRNGSLQKQCNDNINSEFDSYSNNASELRFNINKNKLINNTNTPYSPPHRDIRTHSPPVPQNVIDGMVYFLEMLFPSFDSS